MGFVWCLSVGVFKAFHLVGLSGAQLLGQDGEVLEGLEACLGQRQHQPMQLV